MKTYFMSDIHGCYYTLKNAIEDIQEKDPSKKRFVFLGDYVNRGPNSKGVIEYLIELSKKEDCVFVRGNHDDVFSYILGNESLTDFGYFINKNYNRSKVSEWFSSHGLLKTVSSYENDLETVPETHKEFLNNLVPYHRDERFIAVHSWFPAAIRDELTQYDFGSNFYTCLMWNGYRREQAMDKDFGNFHDVPIFMGHTPVSNYTGSTSILISGKKVFIDGGLSIKEGGKLLVAVLNEDDSISEMRYERDSRDV